MAKIASKEVVGNTVVFTFGDGRLLTCDPSRLSDAMKMQYMLHGISQKAGDSYSGAGKETDPIGYAFEMASSVWDATVEGNWNSGRASGGGSSLVLAALIRLYPDKEEQDIKDLLASIKEKDEKGIAKLAKDPRVALVIAEIQLERKQAIAEADEGTSDLLAGFTTEE